jgi:hypothetical protein
MGQWRYSSTILDPSTRWTLVVTFTPSPLYVLVKRPPYPLDRSLGRPQSRSGLCGVEKALSPAGTQSLAVPPAARRYTYWKIRNVFPTRDLMVAAVTCWNRIAWTSSASDAMWRRVFSLAVTTVSEKGAAYVFGAKFRRSNFLWIGSNSLKITVFQNMTSCSPVNRCQRLGGKRRWIHIQGINLTNVIVCLFLSFLSLFLPSFHSFTLSMRLCNELKNVKFHTKTDQRSALCLLSCFTNT